MVACLGHVDYRSPTDSVTVEIPDVSVEEDLEQDDSEIINLEARGRGRAKRKRLSREAQEAIEARRAAVKERTKQREVAWRNWVKPVLKPGDIVALFSPIQPGNREYLDSLLLVHRFWIENDERSRHVFYIHEHVNLPPDITNTCLSGEDIRGLCSSIEVGSSIKTTNVRCTRMAQRHSRPRGVQRYRPVSSIGTLSNGEMYFIYRFLLFWDGFEFTKGKSASGDGLYLFCLNIPFEARSSASAVRVICLTPPGVKTSPVLKLIEDDLVQGVTEGFVDVDADGVRRRIFLDLVGVLGDTPALNEVLDVLGHTSNACCHLCRFVRHSATLVGSRYADTISYGLQTQSGRSFWVHRALRDCYAREETCRLLGLKDTTPTGSHPLHSLMRAFSEAQDRIPETSNGVRVVPGIIDPYRCSFVAPDHLLTGHLRDCLNLAFKLLPSKRYRMSCESHMIFLLHDCELPIQNRLFDHEKRSLYSMSMSELYALGIVAEYAFMKGCDAARSGPGSETDISPKSKQAMFLVGSCARLISRLWLPVDGGIDESNYIRALHAMTDTHLDLVRDICTLKDEDFGRLEDRRISAVERKRLEK